jgi:hypothetical protein
MSAILHGMIAGDVIPQSDFSADQNENRGWSATQTFRIRKGDVDNVSIGTLFQIATPLKDFDPNCDTFFDYLLMSRITSVKTIEGGWTDITCEFVGFGGSQSATDPPLEELQPTYSKRGTLRQAPLSDHPKWKALSENERDALGKIMNGDWLWGLDPFETDGSFYTYVPLGEITSACIPDPIASPDAIEFAKRIAQGVTTYDLGTYEYSHRWESNVGISTLDMVKLGRIAEPAGEPTTPGFDRDWILVGLNEEQHGSGEFRFTNELQYILSDEGGHDDFLYTSS